MRFRYDGQVTPPQSRSSSDQECLNIDRRLYSVCRSQSISATNSTRQQKLKSGTTENWRTRWQLQRLFQQSPIGWMCLWLSTVLWYIPCVWAQLKENEAVEHGWKSRNKNSETNMNYRVLSLVSKSHQSHVRPNGMTQNAFSKTGLDKAKNWWFPRLERWSFQKHVTITTILARVPSSVASMVTTALSVSTSHKASPASTLSPATKEEHSCWRQGHYGRRTAILFKHVCVSLTSYACDVVLQDVRITQHTF